MAGTMCDHGEVSLETTGPIQLVNPVIVDNLPVAYNVRDVNSGKEFRVASERVRAFEGDLSRDSAQALAATTDAEYVVECIYDSSNEKSIKNRKFHVHWKGYEPCEDTWEPYENVKDCEVLDILLGKA
ncbi:Chromo (CHRromatin Organization MOdifier) domain [Carpediemonas membranifera]|uniref:Chromo (CHRromatin Organization MOdifier) domain n=1 Tax=Carpediemonas membranifera TaxID=201153 RepID=A0A8J6DXP1_9EUKA|nr:Chromo (CHRromatin Organization MOdifier) domain [Carpediemonas membranifera]|eukprot:KAG9390699.1 Chromo (CHRromatin Organization MOdifier) domain [Carpediemonas membranifera]